MRTPAPGESAASSAPAANTLVPSRKVRVRPMTSPRRPPTSAKVAAATRYPPTIHERARNETSTSSAMPRLATPMAVVLSPTTAMAMHTATTEGCGRQRWSVIGSNILVREGCAALLA